VTGANGHPYSAAMREAPSPVDSPYETSPIWPHVLALVGELGFLLVTSHYFARARSGLWEGRFNEAPPSHVQWSSAGYALTLVIGILTAYQIVQTVRRKSAVLVLNARRCQLIVALGVIAVGARVLFDVVSMTLILWGLFCLWAYKSLDFVKRPFNRE
jgi:hypothetical protein